MRVHLFLLAALSCSPANIVYGQDLAFYPSPTPVLSDQIQVCKHLVLAKWIASEKAADQDEGSSRFEIVEIGFSRGDRFQPGQVIEMRGNISGLPNANYALMGRDDRTEGWYSPLVVSADGWIYITKMPLPTRDPEAQTERLSWFFDYLEHRDPLICADAFAELSSPPRHLIMSFRDKFPREKLLIALANSDTPAPRIPFYGLMAGYCGRPEDAAILEKKIFVLDAGYQPYISAVVIGYLLIRGEEGLKVLDDRIFRARVVTNFEGKEVSLPFSVKYATMQALESMWIHEPDRLPKDRLKQSMQILLDCQELADLAIANLARWKDWSIQDRLMTMYSDDKIDISGIKRSIVVYLYCCSQDKGGSAADGSVASLPAHAVKAEQNLKLLKEKDPKTVGDALRFFPKVKAAPTAYRRTPPIVENAEVLERIAKASSHGLLGCGDGSFQFLDHSGRTRRIFSGLDPIHVFGDRIDAKTLSEFLEARAEANKHKDGPMDGERRFLLETILYVVQLSEDVSFIELLAPLLGDPIPEVRESAQAALLSIADRNASRRMQALELLNKYGRSHLWLRGNRNWIPENVQ